VAREVVQEGKLGGQAEVKGVTGVWKDLTANVNSWQVTYGSVRTLPQWRPAIATRRLSRRSTVDVRAEIRQLKETVNHDGGPAQRFADRSDPRRA